MKSIVNTSSTAVDSNSKEKVVIIKRVETTYLKSDLNHKATEDTTSYFTKDGQEINKTSEFEFTYANDETRKLIINGSKKSISFFNEHKLNDIKVLFDTLRNTSICMAMSFGIAPLKKFIDTTINESSKPIIISSKELLLSINHYSSFFFMAIIFFLLVLNLGWMTYSFKEKSNWKWMNRIYITITWIIAIIVFTITTQLITPELLCVVTHSK